MVVHAGNRRNVGVFLTFVLFGSYVFLAQARRSYGRIMFTGFRKFRAVASANGHGVEHRFVNSICLRQ
jgi:hypothetical protein